MASDLQTGPWLETPQALDQWLAALPAGTPVGLDSEFERTTTFRAIPGLVQVASPDDAYLIEPAVAEQAEGFKHWLADPEQPKLLYAMSEDAELFREWLGVDIHGVLDLQLAAALAGEGMSVGYARIVERLLGSPLDKEQTRSDWLQRPLTPEQVEYALADVIHLHDLYDLLTDKLRDRDMLEAAWWETERFLADQQKNTSPEEYYLRLRGAWFLPPEKQGALQALVEWREKECRRRNRPRNRVLNDKALIALAENLPGNRNQLSRIDGLPPVVVRKYHEQLLDLIADASKNKVTPEQLVPAPLTREEQGVYRELKGLIQPLAEAADVPMELLAPRRKLEAIVRDALREGRPPEELETGWRGNLLAPVQEQIRALLSDS
ncbi:HRDC domain-containing protein [Marinobacteraceae bacterium S3BR75-40.1]